MNNHILLIDLFLPDIEFIEKYTLDKITTIYINEKVITLDNCFKKIMGTDDTQSDTFGVSQLEKIGLIKCNNGRFFNLPIVENLDITLLKEVKNFFRTLKVYGLQYFDLISCSSFDNNWKNFINIIKNECDIVIRSSVNVTGYGGDWILESNNVDLINLYFNENIKGYKHSLEFSSHMMFIDNNKLYGWGNGSHNRIGKYPTFAPNQRMNGFHKLILKDIKDYNTATKQISLHVNSGALFVLLNDTSGTLYSLGPDWTTGRGLRGDFRVRMSLTPVPQGKIPDQVITGGYGFSFIKMTDGTVYATGNDNQSGVLGLGHNNPVGIWTQVPLPNNIPCKKIAVSFHTFHVLLDDETGSIYSAGWNNWGQFGNGTYNSSNTLTKMTTVPQDKIPIDIISGSSFIIVLMNDGSIYICGLNDRGQCGYNPSSEYGISHTLALLYLPLEITQNNIKPKQIACGSNHTLILFDDDFGSLFSFGYNNVGQCGQGGPNNNNIWYATPIMNTTGKTPVKISCGNNATYVLMDDNTLYGMGSFQRNWNTNEYGPKYFLGPILSDIIPKFDTIYDIYSSSGMDGLFLIFNDIRKSIYLIVTTVNGEPIRNFGIEMGENYNPLPTNKLYYPSNSIPKSVTMGSTVSYVIDTNGKLYVVGYSDFGQLGMGDISLATVNYNDYTYNNGWDYVANWQTPLTIPSGKKVLQVTCSTNSTHILLDDYTIYSCGWNYYGIFGNGQSLITQNKSFVPMDLSMLPSGTKPKKIVAGWTTLYVLLDDASGSVYACGENSSSGSFGINTSQVLFSTLIQVPIPDNKVPIDIVAGLLWFVVLMSDGTLYSSGDSNRNATGNGGNYLNWSKTLIPMITTNIPSGLNPKKIVSSEDNLYVLMDDPNGSIYCCGDNQKYQCGIKLIPNTTVPILTKMDYFPDNFNLVPIDIFAIKKTTFIKMSNGELWSCGENGNGQCGIGIEDDSFYYNPTQPVMEISKCRIEDIIYLRKTENYSFDELKFETGFSFMKVISEGEYTKDELTYEGLPLQKLVRYSDTNIAYLKTKYTYQDFLQIGYSKTKWLTDLPPAISPVCFIAGTPVVTDQGIINIENIEPNINTINGRKIKAITCTKSPESHLVKVEKHAFNKNIPSKDIVMSKNHKIYYNGTMIPISNFVNYNKNVVYVTNQGENLYNILFEKHGLMVINNLVVETLDPSNIIAQLYTNNYTFDEIDKLIRKMNYLLETKQNDKYLDIYSKLKK